MKRLAGIEISLDIYLWEPNWHTNKNDVMRLGERPRSLEGKPNYLDLPFAIKLYYSMSTISYTPWFSYQINMTLIECSRIRKTRPFAWRSDSEPP